MEQQHAALRPTRTPRPKPDAFGHLRPTPPDAHPLPRLLRPDASSRLKALGADATSTDQGHVAGGDLRHVGGLPIILNHQAR